MSINVDGNRDARVDAPSDSRVMPTPVDIYALLGISPTASPALARQLYWLKIDEHQRAKERGDAGAGHAIEELNEALRVVLDDERRAAYDRARRASAGGVSRAAGFDRTRRARAGAIVAVMLGILAATLGTAWWAGLFALSVVLIVGMLILVAAVAWQRRDGSDDRSPFSLLGLRDDAHAPEVHAAYEMAMQELLSRVRFDPAVIRRLERLDQAYLRARRAMAERGGAEDAVRRGLASRAACAMGRAAVAVGAFVVDGMGRLALLAGLWFARLMTRVSRAVSRRVRGNSARGMRRAADELSHLSRLIQGVPREEDRPIVVIDVARRAGLRSDRDVIGGTPTAAGDGGMAVPEPARPAAVAAAAQHDEGLVEAYLVLESAAGNRRVPIRSVPLRIGSGPECHLVLPPELGLAPEHALIWQRDGVLLLHVVDPTAGACLVNDEAMTWAALDDRDVVRLAGARFHIEVPSVPAM